MNGYKFPQYIENTSLWKRTLGKEDWKVARLRKSFFEARNNAAFLLDKIHKDFPDLTIHDITHVDSLWRVADTIIGPNYCINPLEGYILGIAFLIHDAALSYDAADGVTALRNTIEWKDYYAMKPEDMEESEFEKHCDFMTIRALHAKYAEHLLDNRILINGENVFIVGDDLYRRHLKGTIGKIASSHHWEIDEVKLKLREQANPPDDINYESDWEYNEQKLACILRCADAGHIDSGRAPDNVFFNQSLIINKVSRKYWEAQNRLGIVREYNADKTKLLISSDDPFPKENFDAWNVAYDAVVQFDEELKKSNELLKHLSQEGLEFPHQGVVGAESKESLSKHIKTTEDWKPCNFGVHTSNVKMLIEKMGGEQLYGSDNRLLVVMRELIQNARDAIYARSKLDNRYKIDENNIIIKVHEEKENKIIRVEVEDNGIGMSLECIKNYFLDFGKSYWKSTLSRDENPGLLSGQYSSIGEFGIGFYSIFMVAKSVEVITRRYSDGMDAWKVEFPKGLTMSPILSQTKLSTNVSTIVRFELDRNEDIKINVPLPYFKHVGYRNELCLRLEKALSIITIGLDANVMFETDTNCSLIHINILSPMFNKHKWLNGLLSVYPDVIKDLALKFEEIIDDSGRLRGLLLPPECFYGAKISEMPYLETIGGLAANLNFEECNILGYLDGKSYNISRNRVILDNLLLKSLKSWATQKYRRFYNNHIDELTIPTKNIFLQYSELIKYIHLSDSIVQDNTRFLYKKYQENQENKDESLGTLFNLSDIHKKLFSGIFHDPGQICGYEDWEIHIIQANIERDKDSTKSIDQIIEKHTTNTKLRYLFKICFSPESNFEQIIRKYVLMSNLHPFRDGNKRSLRIWVNQMLYQNGCKMIDWDEVNDIDINLNTYYMCCYLERFLSSTYLEKVTN